MMKFREFINGTKEDMKLELESRRSGEFYVTRGRSPFKFIVYENKLFGKKMMEFDLADAVPQYVLNSKRETRWYRRYLFVNLIKAFE